jgi:hypothetical protein
MLRNGFGRTPNWALPGSIGGRKLREHARQLSGSEALITRPSGKAFIIICSKQREKSASGSQSALRHRHWACGTNPTVDNVLSNLAAKTGCPALHNPAPSDKINGC